MKSHFTVHRGSPPTQYTIASSKVSPLPHCPTSNDSYGLRIVGRTAINLATRILDNIVDHRIATDVFRTSNPTAYTSFPKHRLMGLHSGRLSATCHDFLAYLHKYNCHTKRAVCVCGGGTIGPDERNKRELLCHRPTPTPKRHLGSWHFAVKGTIMSVSTEMFQEAFLPSWN